MNNPCNDGLDGHDKLAETDRPTWRGKDWVLPVTHMMMGGRR